MGDWTCGQCGWVNREVSEACLSCGAQPPSIAPAEEHRDAGPGPGGPRSWDLGGAPEGESAAKEPYEPPAPRAWLSTRGLAGGLAVAALAAVAASAIWYAVVAFSSYQIGFIAIAVGWVIGTGAVFGARGRGSLWLSAASGVLTLLSLAVSEYLIAYHWATREMGIAIDLIQPPDVMIAIVLDILAADPATLLFWGLAVAAAVYVPFKQVKPRDQAPAAP